ncbi:MAG TPA: aminoacyl-tRNA hydrolase [Polyangia bacterium]|jgi:PTH1 family peptidyl-tRNA hydrolase|nr:aminoacyl-tRNA hydrolase [Polyangia bacterium]
MHLVVGLGNPGPQYADNRHNVGFMVVDELARRGRAGAPREKFGAELLEATIRGNRLLLCKPQEYMNVSGQAVARVAAFWKIGLAETVVVHDELDVPFDRMKLGAGGGPGGHNGVKSIISALGDPGFARVRVGIGRPAPGRDPSDYVLSDFSRAEAAVLADLVGRAADAVEAVVGDGLNAAMNRFNGKAQK